MGEPGLLTLGYLPTGYLFIISLYICLKDLEEGCPRSSLLWLQDQVKWYNRFGPVGPYICGQGSSRILDMKFVTHCTFSFSDQISEVACIPGGDTRTTNAGDKKYFFFLRAHTR